MMEGRKEICNKVVKEEDGEGKDGRIDETRKKNDGAK